MAALTKVQLKLADKKKGAKSILSKLSEQQSWLFKLLSTQDRQDYNPRIPEHTKKLLADKNDKRAWNILEDGAKDRSGKSSKPGFVQFLPKGCVSFQHPSGFASFMFLLSRFTAECIKISLLKSPIDLSQKESISEEDINFYADFDYFILLTMEEDQTQLK